MKNQRLISDARRRAKAISRAETTSYQSCLDEVARSTGAADWTSFVADPRPLPPFVGKEPPEPGNLKPRESKDTVPEHEFVGTDKNRYKDAWKEPVDWKRLSNTFRREGHKAPIITLFMFAMVLLLFRSPLAHYIMEMPPRVGLVILVGPLFMGGALLGFYLLGSITGGVILSVAAYQRRPRLGIAYWSRIWGDVAMRTALAGTLYFGFAYGSLDLTFGTSQTDAASIAKDARTTRQIEFATDLKPLPMGPVVMGSDRSVAEMVIADFRSTPKALRISSRFRKYDGGDFVRAVAQHPVIRIKGVVDCRHGTFMSTAFTTADTFGGPAMYTMPKKGRRWVPLAASSMPLLCSGGGSSQIVRS